jgi:hypothetical protein
MLLLLFRVRFIVAINQFFDCQHDLPQKRLTKCPIYVYVDNIVLRGLRWWGLVGMAGSAVPSSLGY